MVFHVLNRGVGRMKLFRKDADYRAFEAVVEETLDKRSMRICGYCLMPNHWHFVMWPEHDGDLAAFMQRLTITHVRRWQEHRDRVGYGHLYQSRYKSFPVQSDEYFFQVMRYVERNALRANLCDTAESWRWSSLYRRVSGNRQERAILADWPLPLPRNWKKVVNDPQTDSEVQAIRRAVSRGRPYGDSNWAQGTAQRLGLESTMRAPHRPKKAATEIQ